MQRLIEEEILTEMQVVAMKIMCIFFFLVALFVGCGKVNDFFGMNDDSFIEENAEKLIEEQLELEPGTLDLTPRSPEN